MNPAGREPERADDSYVSVLSVRLCFNRVITQREASLGEFVSQNVVNMKKGGVKKTQFIWHCADAFFMVSIHIIRHIPTFSFWVTMPWSEKTKNTWPIWQTGRNNSIPSATTLMLPRAVEFKTDTLPA